MGVRSEKSAGAMLGVFGTFSLRRIGLTVTLQLPNSYPCIRVQLRSERQFDLSVSVKGNVDAVQSKGRTPDNGLMLAYEHAPRSKGFVYVKVLRIPPLL